MARLKINRQPKEVLSISILELENLVTSLVNTQIGTYSAKIEEISEVVEKQREQIKKLQRDNFVLNEAVSISYRKKEEGSGKAQFQDFVKYLQLHKRKGGEIGELNMTVTLDDINRENIGTMVYGTQEIDGSYSFTTTANSRNGTATGDADDIIEEVSEDDEYPLYD